MEISERIRLIMKTKGVTGKGLAEKMGVNRSTLVNNIDAKNPTMSTLEPIAAALGVEVWELFISREELEAERERRKSARLRQIVALTTTCPCCGEPVCLRTLANVK